MATRLSPGTSAPAFQAVDLNGNALTLQQYSGRYLLLQFYRFSGCPMCDLRLRDFSLEYPQLHERGLEAVAFFHSSPDRLRRHFSRRALPFPIAADPSQRIYRAYGVETSWPRLLLSMVKPSFYVDWARSMRYGFWGGFDVHYATMPADFLIGPDGKIIAVHYGADIGDHMKSADILRMVPPL
jgi:thioredoxin-dependent peroxiredoxin